MLASRTRLLLTGFGPFPGVPENPTSALVERFAQALGPYRTPSPDALVLPVDWRSAGRRLSSALRQLTPEIVIMFGVSSKATGFLIERFAFNRIVPRFDALEHLPSRGPVSARFSSRSETIFPVAALARSLRRGGWPAEISRSAGRYLCNFCYLHALEWGAAHPAQPLVVFIHVPMPRAETAMNFNDLLAGALHIVEFAEECYAGRSIPDIREQATCSTGAV